MSFWMVLLERSSSGSIRLALLALGPIAAIAFYGYIMSRYRNADKSYQFEETTRVELQDVQGSHAGKARGGPRVLQGTEKPAADVVRSPGAARKAAPGIRQLPARKLRIAAFH